MEEKDQQNKHKNWCITVNETEDCPLPTYDQMVKLFESNALLYLFQKEKGEVTGRPHYQCVVKFKLRKRKSTILNILKVNGFKPHQWQLTPMYGTWEENLSYCSKQETRLESPVTNCPVYEGADISFLEDIRTRYPWQEYLLNQLFINDVRIFKTPDDRKIYWITDECGNSGKSKFTKYLVLRNNMCCKVPFGTATQLRSAIISAGIKKLYVCDVPRTLGKDDDLNSIISVLEDLKNGFIVSSMYGKNVELLMNPPHVVVFSNRPCPMDKMSKDRWVHVYIKPDKSYEIVKSNEHAYYLSINKDSKDHSGRL